MILDHIDNLCIPDDECYGNEVRSLRTLGIGLAFLNAQVASIEQKVRGTIPPYVRVFSYGNDPRFAQAMPLIECAFHWYAVSGCNYVGLVGWLAKQIDPGRPDPKQYVRDLIPAVVTYRNKVAGHFAKASPGDDNLATLDASVLHSVAFSDDRFYAGVWRLTQTSQGTRSSSPDMRWSLTKTHTELVKRYWPVGNR